MPIIARVRNASSGRFALLNGFRRPDFYRFNRSATRGDVYELPFATVADWNKVAEDLMTGPGNPPVFLEVTPDPGAADAALEAELLQVKADAEKTAADLRAQVARLGDELDAAQVCLASLAEKPGGLTAEQNAMLLERDAMLEVLTEHGGEKIGERTPIQYLRDVLLPSKPEPVKAKAPKTKKA